MKRFELSWTPTTLAEERAAAKGWKDGDCIWDFVDPMSVERVEYYLSETNARRRAIEVLPKDIGGCVSIQAQVSGTDPSTGITYWDDTGEPIVFDHTDLTTA